MLIILAAVLAAAAVLVLGAAPPGIRRVGDGAAWADVRGAGRPQGGPITGRSGGGGSWPAWVPRAACALAGLALGVLLGGIPGVVVGLTAALGGPPLLARLETRAHRQQRLALVAGAPLAADLLAASLAAGVPVERSLPVIARAMGAPVGEQLERVAAHIRLGEPAEVAWSRVAELPGLGPIATTVARSARSGAPLAGLLVATADDLREQAAAAALAEVRAVSVRAVLPLGLCLLPAFALLGVLPVVAGLMPEF